MAGVSAFNQQGGCQCGAVRYTLNAKPFVVYCCHCTECQKQSSSAFGISVRVDTAALTIEGDFATFEQTISGKMVIRQFCPTCGTRLFHRRKDYAAMLNIKGGTFDDTHWLTPAGHIWTGSKMAWVLLPDDAMTYEGQPENYDVLAGRYQSNW